MLYEKESRVDCQSFPPRLRFVPVAYTCSQTLSGKADVDRTIIRGAFQALHARTELSLHISRLFKSRGVFFFRRFISCQFCRPPLSINTCRLLV